VLDLTSRSDVASVAAGLAGQLVRL